MRLMMIEEDCMQTRSGSRGEFVAWHNDRTLFTYNIAAYMLVGAGSLVLKLYRHKGGKGP